MTQQLFLAIPDSRILKNKYILLDNDFLTAIFSRPEILERLILNHLSNWEGSYFIISPYTKLEFLRDSFIRSEIEVRDSFLQTMDSVAEQSEIETKIRKHAIELSRIYKHQNCKGSPSLVDLLLAGTVMNNDGKMIIITGNKKDFPNLVFDTLGIITIEDQDTRNYYLLNFNHNNYVLAKKRLDEIKVKLPVTDTPPST